MRREDMIQTAYLVVSHLVLCHVVVSRLVSSHVVVSRLVACAVCYRVHCDDMRRDETPYHTIALPCNTMPYHAISCHTTPVPYYTEHILHCLQMAGDEMMSHTIPDHLGKRRHRIIQHSITTASRTKRHGYAIRMKPHVRCITQRFHVVSSLLILSSRLFSCL